MKHSMDSLRKAQTNSNRTMATLTLAMTFVVIAFVSALSTGKYPITLSGLAAGDPMALRTFTVLRLPRAVMGLIGGFGLGIAGFVYQTVFRNPLASPDIIGVSSGASAGAAFAILFVSAAAPSTTLFAFFGALLAVCLSLGLTALPGPGPFFHRSRGDRGPCSRTDRSHALKTYGRSGKTARLDRILDHGKSLRRHLIKDPVSGRDHPELLRAGLPAPPPSFGTLGP